MDITLQKIRVEELVNGYKDNAVQGVLGYAGNLNIRPAYQREFVYKDKQRDAVIHTVQKGLPLNIMYWADNEDGSYELLDGQQRTISICQYVVGDFSIDYRYFHNLTDTEKQQILDYELMVYVCKGTTKEKLDWFEIVNIAGVSLTPQELRNAVYTGPWLADAKLYFSKPNCNASNLASKYIKGTINRQDYLEASISWIAFKEGITIDDYMALHQHDTSATELWLYFSSVITWVTTLFPKDRAEMKNVPWGLLFNKYHTNVYDPKQLETKLVALMQNEDVLKRSGIYEYLFDDNEKHLNIRAFSDNIKRMVYTQQLGICPICKVEFTYEEMEGDHIIPWCKGGKTDTTNCQMLCKACNREKSNK